MNQPKESRIAVLKKFLKQKGLDPDVLSEEQLNELQDVFHYQSGDEVIAVYNLMVLEMKKGGPIHIKKQNRGEFTKYCKGKVTQECIDKGKKSRDPKIRKRANFAWVAKHKFKHEDGGKINYLNIFQ